MRRGFTLIQISLLLIVASLVLVAVLPSTRTNLNANIASTIKMNAVLTALRGYEAAHAALPCPADASQPIGSASYGVAAANPGTGTPGNCTGGTPAADYIDTTNSVATGMVPVRTLGLSNDYALDAYGRDITYAVDTNATVCFAGVLAGKITVTDNGTANQAVAALLSHGADGHGAWIPLTGSAGTAVRLNAGSTDADQLTNAHVNSSFTPVTPLTNFVRKLPTATFDDLLVYKSNLWNLNTEPASVAALAPAVVPPTNGNYFTYHTGSTNGTLTFTLTFGNTVTVNTSGGTPELALSVPQLPSGTTASAITRYATYSGESGNAITFTYNVSASDYAPNGIAWASSSISLNGGTITVNNLAACLNFVPPSLTGVLLNPVLIYVTDTANCRVQQFDIGGNYLSTFGTCGSGNGHLNSPSSQAADSNGNVWVSDNGNNRVEEFDNSGNYLGQFGSAGSGNGQFNNPYGNLSIDAGGNIWVADTNNNRVQKFNGSGAYQSQFGSAGGGNGQFNSPQIAAFDSGGNIWVTDFNNNRAQKFNSSGVYQGQFGSLGSANGQFTGAGAIAIDAGNNIWVADYYSNRVEKFNISGTYLSQIGCASGACTFGTGNGQFNHAGSVAIDPNGNVWVSDNSNNRVEEFNGCGNYIAQFGTAGSGNGQFNNPGGIFITGPHGGGGACITSVSPPANGGYSTGQTLTFTVTYDTAVAVTGTPQLVLTIGSNTRYANYVSGSGTTTLTFTYTIQASDTATGIAASSTINLNGGTISSNGITASQTFAPPALGGISINSTAFMLVADRLNNRVVKFDIAGNFVSQIGCASGACAGGSTNGLFNAPTGSALDGSGNIWVMDGSNNRVQKFDGSGNWLASLGGTASACSACLCAGPGNCPAGGGSGNGQFNNPYGGLTIDGSGNIWVADYGNHRLQEFDSGGNFKTIIGGTNSCSAGFFSGLQNVHLDSSGNIYTADNSCGQIEEFNSSGTYIKTFGPTIPGYGTVSGDLDDIAFDSCGNIWWQDEGNSYLMQTDYAGNYVRKISNGIGMQSLAIDSTGKIYSLSESSNNISIYDGTGNFLSTITPLSAFSNAQGITIAGNAVTRLPLSGCSAVILSAAGPTNGTYTTGGTLGFAVTYDRAVTLTGTPQISVTIGANTRQANYISGSGTTTLTFQYTVVAGDNAQAGITENVPISLNSGTITANSIAAGLYFYPPTLTQVLVNPATYSDFYIADTGNHRVRKVTQSTGFISTVAGTGTSGAFIAGAATSSKLNAPSGVTLDGSGNLYIADSGNHAVAKVTPGGTLSYFAGTGTSGTITAGAATSSKLNSPTGVAFDSSGNAYIADGGNSEVLKVTSGGTLSIFAGTGTSGAITAGVATSSKLATPTGVAVDSSGNVYIADGGDHAVLKVSGGNIAYFAGTGATGSTHENDGSLATVAKLKTPYGLAVDSSNNIYITDSGNDVILEVAASNSKISTLTGTIGTASYTGDGGASATATESAAKGVGVDGSGNVYIADTGNNRIRWIITAAGTINPLAGNGTGAYAGDGAAATSGEIKAPVGLAVSR